MLPFPSRTHGTNTRGHGVRFEESQSSQTEDQSQNPTGEVDMEVSLGQFIPMNSLICNCLVAAMFAIECCCVVEN